MNPPRKPSNRKSSLPSTNSNKDLPIRTHELEQKLDAALTTVLTNPDQRQEVISTARAVFEQRFSGPLPHPSHLEAYEKICPNSADRIIKMAEIAQERSENRKDKLIDLEYKDRRLGLILGFSAIVLVIIAGVVGAIIAALHNQTPLAFGFGSLSALSLIAGAFIQGRKQGPEAKAKQAAEKPSEEIKAKQAGIRRR